MSDWQTLSSKEVYHNPWIRVREDKVLNHNGKPLTYGVVETHHPSVAIVAMNDAREVLFQRGYRYTIDKQLWEIPAGHSDGQDLLVAAKRELLEETGLSSEKWTKLGLIYSAVGIGNIQGYVFIAEDVQQASDERDKDEQITDQHFFSWTKIDEMVSRGEIENAFALSALYLARIHLRGTIKALD